MNLRVLALVAGVLGGACWVARWGADLAGGDPGWGGTAHWLGLGLIGLALAALGAGLVHKGAVWLQVIVAIALPLLVWSVYAVVKGEGEGIALDGVLGALAAVLSIALLLAGPRGSDQAPQRHGAHAR
jgi:hypothetical protein